MNELNPQDYKYNMEPDIHVYVKAKEGKKILGTTGLVDNRLFVGDNFFHLVMELSTCFWYAKMDKGVTPEPLRAKFTNYQKALNHLTAYLDKRNLEIKEIKDH